MKGGLTDEWRAVLGESGRRFTCRVKSKHHGASQNEPGALEETHCDQRAVGRPRGWGGGQKY